MSASKAFLTVREFAKFTGLSDKTIRRRIREGRLLFHQPGGPRTKILIPSNWSIREAEASGPALPMDPGLVRRFRESHPHEQQQARQLPGPKPRWR
jgi:excisionase family DNA binding protein